MRYLGVLVIFAPLFWSTPLFAEPWATGQGARQVCHQLRGDLSAARSGCLEAGERGSAKSAVERGGGVSFPLAEYPPAELFLFDGGRRPSKAFP